MFIYLDIYHLLIESFDRESLLNKPNLIRLCQNIS